MELRPCGPNTCKVKGDTIIFDFPGKSGVKQHRELRDRRVARLVERVAERQSAREVFAFRNGDDQLVDVKRRHINQYIKEIMGHNFSAKDFRTWAGTLDLRLCFWPNRRKT